MTQRATCHTFGHSLATHLLEDAYDIRTVQKRPGYQDVKTTCSLFGDREVRKEEQVPLLFEWDSNKARSNFEKHGVTFDEASTAFADGLSVRIPDPLHSQDEERFVLLGQSYRNRLLVVVHTDRGDRIRIISARRATRKERIRHEENEQ